MAQRISRAKTKVSGVSLDQPGDLVAVMHVLYLMFNEGYSGDVDLAAEAISLALRLTRVVDDPEVAGLASLMLLHHARRPARTRADGSLVPLAEQDRSLWDVGAITEGVTLLQAEAEMDAGPIWATRSFYLRPATKASVYRNEVTDAAVACVLEALEHWGAFCAKRWKPTAYSSFKKAQKHTALADVYESIDELAHYRAQLFAL